MYFLAFDFGILLSLNLIFYIVLGFAILGGFLSGLKKSLFRLITMAIFYILFFVTLNLAVGFLWKTDLSFLGQYLADFIDPSLAGFVSFEESFLSIVQFFIGEEFNLSEMSPEFMTMASGLAMFVLKIVWTVLYFTVILIVYKIICFIIRIIFFKTKKGANKMRSFGALVGAGNGLMAIFIMLIMLGGMMSVVGSMSLLLEEFAESTEENDGTEELNLAYRQDIYQASYSLLSEPTTESDGTDEPMLPGDFQIADAIELLNQMVEEYNSNIFVKVANAIQVKSVVDEDVQVPMHINLFDTVLSFEQNEKTIAFRYELMVMTEALEVFMASEYQETQDLTDIQGDEIRQIFEIISNSKLVIAVLPMAIEYASIEYDQELPVTIEELYDGTIDFEAELATLGGIAGALFDILNGAGYIGGEGSLEQIEVTPENVRDLFADISGSDIILLITETVLFPMLSDSEGDFALIITIPENLDLEAEFLALGEIFAEIIEAEVDFADLMNEDITVTLTAIAKVDLTILLESRLITLALINVLSGNAQIEGLDMLTIPSGISWEDIGENPGELRKILEALNALMEVSDTVDFENLDIDILVDMDQETINTFFDSYIIRATVTDIIKELPLGDMPLVFPDIIYDDLNYFTKDELVSTIMAVKLLIVTENEETTFDPNKILNLTETEIDTLFSSNILYATVGNYFNTMDTSSFVIPDSVNTTIAVDEADLAVVTKEELKNLFSAIGVFELESFEGIEFDATYINRLENLAGDDIDQAEVNTLLSSKIIHATLSDTIIGLDKSLGGMLVVPNYDALNQAIITEIEGVKYILNAEVYAVLRAMYHINITDFNNVDFDDITIITDNFDLLLDSGIIHATITDQIINVSTIVVPETDIDDQAILITVDTVPFITEDELTNLLDGLELLNITDPNSFSQFDLSVLNTDATRTELLESAILHATISDQVLAVDDTLLYVPEQDELGTTLKVTRGVNPTTFIIKGEVKAIIAAMVAMGYTDVDSLSQEIDANKFVDNADLVLESASLQATVSEQILGATAALTIPETDETSNSIKVYYTDVTYITSSELSNFFTSIKLFNIPDLSFDAFDEFNFANLDTDVKRYEFLESAILHATITNQLLDLDDTLLYVPEQDELGTDLITEVGILPDKFIIKAEINSIIKAMIAMGYTDVNSLLMEIDANKFVDNADLVLESASMQATVSTQILNATAALTTPETDELANPIKVYYTDITYITSSELSNFFNSVELFNIVNLSFDSFNQFNFASLDTDLKRYEFLESAILHATITKQMLDLSDDLLYVPEQDELGTDLITEIGVLPDEFIIKAEINAIIKAMIAMGYTDVNSLAMEISPQVFIDNKALVLASASMQATVSNQLLGTSSALIIPDQDQLENPIRIVYSDVTFIESSELDKLLTSVNLFGINNLDFDTFNVTVADVQAVDYNVLFDSYIMVATVSDYFLDAASGDENHLPGTTSLLIPTTARESILVATVSEEAIEKQELIYMLDGFEVLGLNDYSSNFDASIITALTGSDIDQIFLSASIHVTVDNMMRGNANISGKIPALAEDATTYAVTVTTKTEIRDFILATQHFGASDFTSVTFDIYAVAALDSTQRDTVLDSMIVRNILTPEIEDLGTYSLDPYVFVNTDYMNDDPLTFLKETAIIAALTHYGLI